jgi:protein SCO1/2
MTNRKLRQILAIALISFANMAVSDPINLFAINDQWTQDKGKPVKFSDFSGKKLVLAMAYTNCKGACPIIIKKMEKVESLLAAKKIAAEFILVSFDPTRDTAEMLAEFRMHMAIPAEHWSILTGTEKQTRKLGNLLNIHFAKLPGSGEISHDNKIILFNEKGDLVRTIEGLSESLDKLFE